MVILIHKRFYFILVAQALMDFIAKHTFTHSMNHNKLPEMLLHCQFKVLFKMTELQGEYFLARQLFPVMGDFIDV